MSQPLVNLNQYKVSKLRRMDFTRSHSLSILQFRVVSEVLSPMQILRRNDQERSSLV